MTLTVIVDSDSDSGNIEDAAVIIVRTSGEDPMKTLTVVVAIMMLQ